MSKKKKGKKSRQTSFFEVRNLDNIINWLHHVNPKLEKALKKGLKKAAKPVLKRARANAEKIAYTGERRPGKISFRDSLSIAARNSGTVYVLKSTDPAAGVKEYAHVGATRLVGKSSRSSTQKMLKRKLNKIGMTMDVLDVGLREVRVGVPLRADPPRVMIPAVESAADEARDLMEKHLAKVMEEAGRG